MGSAWLRQGPLITDVAQRRAQGLAQGAATHVHAAGMRSSVPPKSAELMDWRHQQPQSEGGRWKRPLFSS